MSAPTWLETAQQLPLGHKTRVDCPECGAGTQTKAMMVSHSLKAYSGFCFACDAKPFEMKGKQTLEQLAELKRLNNELLERTDSTLRLPSDSVDDIPLEGRLWLYSNGITRRLIKQYSIKYSPRLRRVVLPVYDTKGTLIWFQCRALLEGQKPKYLQPSRDKSKVVFESKGRTLYGTKNEVVLVEDIMSAIRVGEVTRTVSLLGTKASQHQINFMSSFDMVTTWFDNDRAGKRGASVMRASMGLLTNVGNILTMKDPKAYSKQQIEEILCQNK
jgi:hypothetical protein